MGRERFGRDEFGARNVALIAVLAASITCGKLALAWLPNVEIVTLLIAIYGYVFGVRGLAATFIFVTIEPLFWSFGTYLVSYFIYWPLVCSCFWLLARLKIKNIFVLTSIATLLTIFFGFFTAFVDIGLFAGTFDNFFYRFGIYYMRGIYFYITHVLSTIATFLCAFKTLSKTLANLNR